MSGRLKQHLLQVQPVGRLYLRPLRDRHPRGAKALGQLVAHLLELAQVEQPRLAGGHGRALKPTHRIGGYEGS
jgi:hypothetical protein